LPDTVWDIDNAVRMSDNQINDWSLDHVTIAVRDLEKSKQLFQGLFGGQFIKQVKLPQQNAEAAYYLINNIVIGLEAPLSDEGDIYQFLQKKGEGIHHLAFAVENIDTVERQLKDSDVRIIAHSDKLGVRRECFTHPKSFMGLLVQLMEWEDPYKSSLQKRIEILGE
jgi:methylmalonyl-CoA/ethylmalonyl-CoA epimerase